MNITGQGDRHLVPFFFDHYLHAIYPWSDITAQKGLWETISNDYRKLTKQIEGDTYIWIDLTKEAVQCLPVAHKFELPSPWILDGTRTEGHYAAEVSVSI